MEKELKKFTKKYFSKLGLIYFIGSILIFAVQILVPQLISLIAPNLIIGYDAYFLSSMLPMYFIAVPILILLIKRIPVATVPEKKKMSVGQWLIAFTISCACLYLSNFVGLILTNIIGIIKNGSVQNTIGTITSLISPATTFFLMVICAPIVEEIIFRKLLIDRASKYGEKVAILLSGFMFGLFHGNLNQFVYAFTLGCLFAFIYTKTRNVIHVILLHMGINFMGSLLGQFILEKSGYMELASAMQNSSSEEVAQLMSTNATGLIIYYIYVILIFALIIAGVILTIVNRKKFVCLKGEIEIPKGHRFTTILLNVGMILYCILWIAMIVLQLFQ